METCPRIGQRVSYKSDVLRPWEGDSRTCTGTVRAIYSSFTEKGSIRPESEWSVGVEVDSPLPKWWPYPGNRFAPDVAELELLA
jgi:hypothetical protein